MPYTAWKYAQEQSLWRALVRVILDELLKQCDSGDAELEAMRDAPPGRRANPGAEYVPIRYGWRPSSLAP